MTLTLVIDDDTKDLKSTIKTRKYEIHKTSTILYGCLTFKEEKTREASSVWSPRLFPNTNSLVTHLLWFYLTCVYGGPNPFRMNKGHWLIHRSYLFSPFFHLWFYRSDSHGTDGKWESTVIDSVRNHFVSGGTVHHL